MTIKAVIFDLDGTLTKPLLNFDQIRAEMGLNGKSIGILEALETMSPQERIKAEQVLIKHEKYAAENSRLNDNAAEVLGRLRQDGYPIGILTRNTMKNALLVSRKHNLIFDAIVDRNSGPAKPDGFGVRTLCETFGVQPRQTLVVGDFLHDVQAANNAGAISILLKTHEDADKFEALAHFSILHLEQIFDIIVEINNS